MTRIVRLAVRLAVATVGAVEVWIVFMVHDAAWGLPR